LETAATDGKQISFDPGFLDSVDNDELDAVLLHDALNAAPPHVPRSVGREPLPWNYAFIPFFREMQRASDHDRPDMCVYLRTDG